MSVTLAATAVSIVLVHGGFVDGSGWQGVLQHLKEGRIQRQLSSRIPTTSLGDDVAVTKRVIAGSLAP